MAREDFAVFVDNLKARAVIEDVVGQYVALKRNGNRYVGLCPFHSEKTGSFTVFADTQSYYCFGCGAGGDVITFIRSIENLDYMDALHFLADRYGMTVPEREGEGEYRHRRAVILEINKEAARHFREVLLSPEGAGCLAYYRKRALTDATIRHFGLGYAKDSWDDLVGHLRKKGYTLDQIETAGLGIRGKKGGLYDRFRDRAIFPIIDTTGNVIAFGGRRLDDTKPDAKYINSPDTPVFKKSRALFGLNFAKNAPGEKLLLCEGNIDVISLHQAGFPFAVAACGTAITSEHARLMARYAKEVYLSLDSDEAGQRAARKAMALLEEAGLRVKVLSYSGAKDPDEYLQKFGSERFEKVLEASGSPIRFELNRALRQHDLSIPEEKAEFLKAACAILAGVNSPVEQEIYLSRVAKETEIPIDMLRAEVKTMSERRVAEARKKALRAERERTDGIRDRLNPERSANLRAARAEEALIALLLKHPDYLKKLDPPVTEADFVTTFNRRIFALLWEEIEAGLSPSLSSLAARLTTEETARLTQYTVQAVTAEDELQLARDCAEVLHEQAKQASLAALSPDEIQNYLDRKRNAKEGVNSDGRESEKADRR